MMNSVKKYPVARRTVPVVLGGLVAILLAIPARADVLRDYTGYTRPGVPSGKVVKEKGAKVRLVVDQGEVKSPLLGGTVCFMVIDLRAQGEDERWSDAVREIVKTFKPGEDGTGRASPDYDHGARYLYLYQTINDMPAADTGIRSSSVFLIDPSLVTSWGHFVGYGFSLTDLEKQKQVIRPVSSTHVLDAERWMYRNPDREYLSKQLYGIEKFASIDKTGIRVGTGDDPVRSPDTVVLTVGAASYQHSSMMSVPCASMSMVAAPVYHALPAVSMIAGHPCGGPAFGAYAGYGAHAGYGLHATYGMHSGYGPYLGYGPYSGYGVYGPYAPYGAYSPYWGYGAYLGYGMSAGSYVVPGAMMPGSTIMVPGSSVVAPGTVLEGTGAMVGGDVRTTTVDRANRSFLRSRWLNGNVLRPSERSALYGFTSNHPPTYDDVQLRGVLLAGVKPAVGADGATVVVGAAPVGRVPTPIAPMEEVLTLMGGGLSGGLGGGLGSFGGILSGGGGLGGGGFATPGLISPGGGVFGGGGSTGGGGGPGTGGTQGQRPDPGPQVPAQSTVNVNVQQTANPSQTVSQSQTMTQNQTQTQTQNQKQSQSQEVAPGEVIPEPAALLTALLGLPALLLLRRRKAKQREATAQAQT